MMTEVLTIFLLLLLAKTVAELVLDVMNRRHVMRFAGALPEGLEGVMDEETYRKSVDYTLAKNRFGMVNTVYDAVVLAVILVSGILPWLYEASGSGIGHSVWADALFLIGVLILLSLPSLPLDWWGQFRLEERFGFNRSTLGLWITDKIKGLAVGLVIGYPLVVLLLAVVGWAGEYWWVWGFILFFAFQMVMIVVYPMWIMPLFNKFTSRSPPP